MVSVADQERIEAFSRELALALRRITGRVFDDMPDDLPHPIDCDEDEDTQWTKQNRKKTRKS